MSSAGGRDEGDLTIRADALGHDEFDDEVVLNLQAVVGFHVAHWIGRWVDTGLEMNADSSARGVEVRLQPVLLFVAANDTRLLMQCAFALAVVFVGVLVARGRHNFLVLFNTPHHLERAPTSLCFALANHIA